MNEQETNQQQEDTMQSKIEAKVEKKKTEKGTSTAKLDQASLLLDKEEDMNKVSELINQGREFYNKNDNDVGAWVKSMQEMLATAVSKDDEFMCAYIVW